MRSSPSGKSCKEAKRSVKFTLPFAQHLTNAAGPIVSDGNKMALQYGQRQSIKTSF